MLFCVEVLKLYFDLLNYFMLMQVIVFIVLLILLVFVLVVGLLVVGVGVDFVSVKKFIDSLKLNLNYV